jgi:DNA excision repair protein ERCC-2
MAVPFPYPLRKNQDLLLGLWGKTLQKGGHLVVESGTGTGKTVCALAPALDRALETGKKVLYLTHTNAQQHQVMMELRRINAVSGKKVFGVAMQGRANMCLLTGDNEEFRTGSPEELSRLCSDRRKASDRFLKTGHRKDPGCKFYEATTKVDFDALLEWCRETLPTAEEFIRHCAEQGTCPYQLTQRLVQHAGLVTAPYICFFHKFIRERLLERMVVPETEIILIIDEAHNLEDFARDLASAKLSIASLEPALKECQEFGDRKLGEDMAMSGLISALREVIYSIKETYIQEQGQEDSLIMSQDLEVEILSKFKVTSVRLKRALDDMLVFGDMVKETRRAQSRLARSYVHSVADFAMFWMGLESEAYARLVCAIEPENPYIEAYCLDPSVVTGVVNECYATLHMSGTLQPLEEYRGSCGLTEDAELAVVPSPFPPENLAKYYLTSVTTRYEDLNRDQEMFCKIREELVASLNAQDRNTAVFFPSFAMLGKMLDMGVLGSIKRHAYVDDRSLAQRELMAMVEAFKSGHGETLMSVIGGRVSEGMDFPGPTLEVAILVGVPYPKPTARHKALLDYYDRRFKKGWDYAVTAPTTRKMLQAIGRVIRNETDRGVAVIMDSRAKVFSRYISDLKMSWDIAKDLRDFFSKT